MKRKSRQNQLVRKFILNNLEKYSREVSGMAAKEFGLSRAAINGYLKRLVTEGLIDAAGNTKARRYVLKPLVQASFTIKLNIGLEEDVVWRARILPLMKGVKQNVVDICQYCFTEILNNAIDHSASWNAVITYIQTYNMIEMHIDDQGIGIFEKIKRDFNLADARTALLELTKGKITSDKKNHSGQGIFFTSRMVDRFNILSGHLFYTRRRQQDDEWLLEEEDEKNYTQGTSITMKIFLDTQRTTREVFDQYQGRDLSFRKTHVPISLGKYPGEQLVSRSQAKRVLARFENFTEVLLDFDGVEEIGQAFADEIFRVFKNAHPEVEMRAVHTSPQIDKMIAFVQAYDKDQKEMP